MDIEQEELQFVDLLGIYKESCKLIYNLRKILTQITLSLILPLSFIFLAQEKLSEILFRKIWFNELQLHDSPLGSLSHDNLMNLVSFEWVEFVLFKLIYLASALVFSLLSTSAVVYTIACAYTSREITFKNIMNVVPRVWKRLIVTLLCAFLAFSFYNVGFVLILFIWAFNISSSTIGTLAFNVILILHASVLVYLTTVWQLASVVSVLEDSYGIKAILKSKRLMKGKMLVRAVISLKINVLILLLNYNFKVSVVYAFFFGKGLAWSLGIGVMCLSFLMVIILLALVVQTVFYLICKSYHHENIDKTGLSEHLEVYLGDYVPLMAKNVQMEDFDHVQVLL